jgi:hypothetical protein
MFRNVSECAIGALAIDGRNAQSFAACHGTKEFAGRE